MLMRHSYAASNNSAWSDRDRPLSHHGRELARTTGLLLASTRPDLIIHSSAVRTTETAGIISEVCGQLRKSLSLDSLYLAPAQSYAEAASLAAPTDKVVLVVGHNPGIAAAIHAWSGEFLSIQPGCVAIFRWPTDDWTVISSDLKALPELTGFISEGVPVR